MRMYIYPSPDARVPVAFCEWDSESAEPESGRVYTLFSDQCGMPLAVEDDTGAIVWWAREVAPWGEVTVDPGSTIELNLRWPGHYFDPETRLHDNRFRSYDPRLGRYLQPDPIGQLGGTNVYAYASNPLVAVDVYGLHPKSTPSSGQSGSTKPTKKAPGKPKEPKPPARKPGEKIDSRYKLTKAQREHYKKRLEANPADGDKIRHERNNTSRKNRGLEEQDFDTWKKQRDNVQKNQRRGREQQDAAIESGGVTNNNKAPQKKYGDSVPDGLSDKPTTLRTPRKNGAVVEVKSVPDAPKKVNGKEQKHTVYDTEQIKQQREAAQGSHRCDLESQPGCRAAEWAARGKRWFR